MIRYSEFLWDIFTYIFKGSKLYALWTLGLLTLVGIGVYAYLQQLEQGFVVTNMTQQVIWGAYIANFTYLVGVAAAAVLLVYPSYIYHKKETKEVVLMGELLAVSAILMCLLFITVDLGRPDHFWHILPIVGKLNFPRSILAWDVVVLNVYLLLNMHIPGYLLYRRYIGKDPASRSYMPFVYLSIIWAISIHTVTAFLYVGLGGRPYWNSAILAPRFLVSAFASGPALLLIIFKTVAAFTNFKVQSDVFSYLKKVLIYALIANLFLLGCEVYKEFYTASLHAISIKYLFFGIHGHGLLRPYIWSAIAMEVLALAVLFLSLLKAEFDQWKYMRVVCVFVIIGIWIEKGMGLLIPGFIPTPLGDVVEYTPSMIEFFVCLGIWSFGLLIFTLMAKVAIAIELGTLSHRNNRRNLESYSVPL